MPRLLVVLGLLLAPLLAHAGDAPEISTSRGKKDGFVVLWTRVVPDDGSPDAASIAKGLQDELVAIARDQRPDLDIDVRPAPERVCPRAGCRATSLGAVLLHQGGGCAVLLDVGAPEGGVRTITPWAGRLALSASELAFREPPESLVTVLDFAPCATVLDDLDEEATLRVRAVLGEAVPE